MAMSKAQKNSLVTNRVFLVKNVIANEELCSHLRAGNHITEAMQEEIMVCAQKYNLNAILSLNYKKCNTEDRIVIVVLVYELFLL